MSLDAHIVRKKNKEVEYYTEGGEILSYLAESSKPILNSLNQNRLMTSPIWFLQNVIHFTHKDKFNSVCLTGDSKRTMSVSTGVVTCHKCLNLINNT